MSFVFDEVAPGARTRFELSVEHLTRGAAHSLIGTHKRVLLALARRTYKTEALLALAVEMLRADDTAKVTLICGDRETYDRACVRVPQLLDAHQADQMRLDMYVGVPENVDEAAFNRHVLVDERPYHRPLAPIVALACMAKSYTHVLTPIWGDFAPDGLLIVLRDAGVHTIDCVDFASPPEGM